MSKITYLASVSDGKISFPSGVLDSTMLSTEVNNTSTNDTIPTSKAVYDSIVNFAPKSITEQDGVVTIKSDKYLLLPQVNQITNSNNYLQKGWYYQHFDISGLGTNEEILSGTKNTVVFWLSDSTEQIVEDIQNPTYIPGFNSGFQIGWWMSGVNDGRFPYEEMCHFEIIAIDANKITVKLYAKNTWNLWWVDGWLRNGKVDLTGSLSKDDYTVYCNGASATTLQERLIQTQCGGVTLSNSSLLVGDANFFGSNKNITCGNSNYTTIGNTLTSGSGLINSTYSGTVLGSYNEPNGGILQVGGGSSESDRKTLFSVHSNGGQIKLNALTEIYKDVNVKNSNNANTVTILAESGDIYVNSTLGANTLKDNANDKVIVAHKSDGGLYKSNVTTQELSNVAGTTSPIQIQINDLTTSTLELSNALITKQNGGQLYLNGGYATTNCKPTFGAAQSLLFTYEVSEAELQSNEIWSIIGNIRVWDNKKGIGIAKNRTNDWQCCFNWGYGQNGDTTSRALLGVKKAQFADGKPHAWALVCGKNATNGFFKLYRDGVLIDSKMTLALFDDFIPQYGFSFGKHQTSGLSDTAAKGRLSRVAFFNFDVSESNAGYTLNDYQSGKSIPPSFNLITPQVLLDLKDSTAANVQWFTRRADAVQYSGVWEDGAFVLKNTADTTVNAEMKQVFYIRPYITLSEKLPAGSLIEVSFDEWVFNTTYFTQSPETPDPDVSKQRFYGWLTVGTSPEMSNFGHGSTRNDKKFRFVTNEVSQKLYFSNYGFGLLNSVSEGDVIPANTAFWKIKGLKIKVNGAALNLENYTIARNTTTRLIKDLSAGGYDATVTGAISGDMDRRVEVFVDELKTQIAQSTATTTE